MHAINKVRKLIKADPQSTAAVVLGDLVLALETEASYQLANIYDLSYEDFELALQIIKEWRLDHYYASKGKLIDLAVQADELRNQSK